MNRPTQRKDRFRITDVFRKMNGKWMIVHHHEGAVPTESRRSRNKTGLQKAQML